MKQTTLFDALPEQANSKAEAGHPSSGIFPQSDPSEPPVTSSNSTLDLSAEPVLSPTVDPKSENNWIELDLPDASIRYMTGFLNSEEADAYLDALKNELMWRQDEITIYGKTFLTPRLQAWYGDPESGYHYSGMSLHTLSWSINLLALKRRCEQAIGTQFNSVLGNWYRDGNDSMGMHADDEAELGKAPVIAALSLGESRPLKFRHKKGLAKVDLPLPHGSLMVMSGQTQAFWQHGISKTKKPINERISLTFRHIFPHSRGSSSL